MGVLMLNKCQKRKKFQHSCIYCKQRLWRLAGSKHCLHREVLEIKQHPNLSRTNVSFLATKCVYVDNTSWIEEFFCGEHGKMWLLVTNDQVASLPG